MPYAANLVKRRVRVYEWVCMNYAYCIYLVKHYGIFISLVPKINVATIQNPPLLDDQRC